MRPPPATLAVVVLALCVLGCTARPGPVLTSVGTETQQITIEMSVGPPLTVGTDPLLPVLKWQNNSKELTFLKSGTGWAKVVVTNFRNAANGNPIGGMAGPCNNLGTSALNACKVAFPNPGVGSQTLFKYDIQLFKNANDAMPAVVLDPVGIIRG